jgi:hypothetical protein
VQRPHLFRWTLVWFFCFARTGSAWGDAPPPDATYVQSEVASFVTKQAAIRNELREGVNRLQSVCKKKAKSETVKLSELQQETSQRLLQNKQRSNEADKLAETVIKRYMDEAKRRRNERCNALSSLFKEKDDRGPSASSCQLAEAEFKSAESLLPRFSEYQEISRTRYVLFQELLQSEARGCARPGFTEQLLGIYEGNNLSVELGVTDYFVRITGKMRSLFQSPSGEGK